MRFILFLSFILLSCQPKAITHSDQRITGKVIKIVDGDTYDLLLADNATLRIRMEGIDAPERGMPYYKVSKDYLGSLCFLQMVRIEQESKDRYGRTVAKTYLLNGSELGLLMIKAGYAWHFKRYSSDNQLANAEIEARRSKTGLWADESPVAPWDWRKNKKQKMTD